MKKMTWYLLMIVLFLPPSAGAEANPNLSITGLVVQPVNLSLRDLAAHQSVEAQLNEVFQDGQYRGVFRYRGVPLRDLLELASIRKVETDFPNPVDLAVVIRNRDGRQVVLSWGEIFYRNPGGILVALSAQPVMPKRDCGKCHTPEVYRERLNQLSRKIGFPKLVMAEDGYADRSLENIASIEVVDIKPHAPKEKKKELFSPEFTVAGAVKGSKTIRDLSAYSRKRARVKRLGEGDGYHGMEILEGAALKDILGDLEIPADLNQVFLVSAPDGYRALFSYGEIFLAPSGDRLMVADRVNGEPPKQGGAFILAAPDDLMANREVKAVGNIDIISLKKDPQIVIIGVGCGDRDLITLEAVSRMAAVDAFVCPPDIQKRFGKYMGEKPVLLDLYTFAPPVLKKKNPQLSSADLKSLMEKERNQAASVIKKALKEGKTVGILEYGDPTIWSGSRWLLELFDQDRFRIIPGLSSFNVSNALMGTDVGCNGAIVLATPGGLKENPSMVKALAEKGETVCIFMGLKDVEDLSTLFLKFYPPQTPALLAYKAGYVNRERLKRTTLIDLAKAVGMDKEKFLGLIYVGPCLTMQETWQCR